MKAYFLVIVITLGMFLLISPSISSSYATHNSIDNKEVRKQAQVESEKISSEKNEKINKIKETFLNFRDAFNSWKVIKETWKSIKNSGDENTKLQTKKLLDEAKILKDKTWQEYVDVRNTD